MSEAPDMAEVIAPIRNRRSSRAFGTDDPTEAELGTLFEAASLAPSSGNAQPWRFVLTRRHTEPFRALAGALRSSNAWARSAPILVATAVRTHHVHPTKPAKENRHALFELGLAVGNLLTQAAALGLSAHPLGGYDREVARGAMEVPGGFELGVLIAIGHATGTQARNLDMRTDPGSGAHLEAAREADPAPACSRDRLRFDQIVFEGVWGGAAGDEASP